MEIELYELKLTEQSKNEFLMKVYDELKKRNMTIKMLAVEINYMPSSVYRFNSDKIGSKFVAAAIQQYLFEEKGE